jgi:hypothetical protein
MAFSRQSKSVSKVRRSGSSKTRAGLAAAGLSCLVGCLSFGACGIGDLVDPINNIANQIQSAITAIDINSAQWQDIVRDLQEQIPAIENDLKSDIDEVLQRGIKATTVSAIAAGDFVARRVQEALERVKAEFTGDPVPVYPPAFLGFAPDTVNVRRILDDEVNSITMYGYDFDRLDPQGKKLELLLLRDGQFVPVDFALTLATHYEGVISFAANGIQMTRGCSLIQLKWDNKVISTLPILQPDPPQPKNIVVNLQGITYKPPHTRGDQEFDGNGPYVAMEAWLAGADFIPGGATALQARVSMFAEETEDDWTTAAGSSEWQTVYRAEPGYRIISILTPLHSFGSYTDNNHSEHVLSPGLGNLVESFFSSGDRSGNDAGVSTQMRVNFTPAEITVIKDDPYFN